MITREHYDQLVAVCRSGSLVVFSGCLVVIHRPVKR